jgi:hypothetical protein
VAHDASYYCMVPNHESKPVNVRIAGLFHLHFGGNVNSNCCYFALVILDKSFSLLNHIQTLNACPKGLIAIFLGI